MIIVGYQGIGKSTLTTEYPGKYIDLESSNFFVEGVRDPNWYKVYINIAEHLSNQGYRVFISSHEIVRNEIVSRGIRDSIIICPDPELKEKWITRLRNRYEMYPTDKNYKALMNAVDRYEDNVNELIAHKGFRHLILHDIEYDLDYLIDYLIQTYGAVMGDEE